MAKPQPKQSIKKPKTLKEQKKELESRLFGEKDKKKKLNVKNSISYFLKSLYPSPHTVSI